MELLKKVSERLEKEYGYDFDSDFWTDEQHTMMQEIIEATESELKKLRVADVSGQSELLRSFIGFVLSNNYIIKESTVDDIISEFERNCH